MNWPNSLGQGGWGNLMDRYANNRYDYNQHRAEEESAKAYRDAAIVSSVAGLLGTLAVVAIAADAQPVAPMMYSQPVQVVQQAPPGHYETRRVLVQEGHYEQYHEWIPPMYSSTTGQHIGGGYSETRTRWVPAIYQEQRVYVQH